MYMVVNCTVRFFFFSFYSASNMACGNSEQYEALLAALEVSIAVDSEC